MSQVALALAAVFMAATVIGVLRMRRPHLIAVIILTQFLLSVWCLRDYLWDVKEVVVEKVMPKECDIFCELHNLGIDFNYRITIPWRRLLIYSGTAIISLLCLVLTLRMLLWIARRTCFRRHLYSLRGITYYESLQPGSTPQEATKLPTFQFAVNFDGLFLRHVGYGIRIDEDWAVVPTHVWRAVEGNAVFAGQKAKVKMQPYVVFSRLAADVTFIKLGTKVFGDLGVTKARGAKMRSGMQVSVVGHDGRKLLRTMGMIVKAASMKYMIKYTGSTLAGFSGAGYANAQTVYAMHSGTTTVENVGVSMQLILQEFEKLKTQCLLESNWEEQDANVLDWYEEQEEKKKWQEDYRDDVEEAYANEYEYEEDEREQYHDLPDENWFDRYQEQKDKKDKKKRYDTGMDWAEEVDNEYPMEYEFLRVAQQISKMKPVNKRRLVEALGTAVVRQSPDGKIEKEDNEVVMTVVEVIEEKYREIAELLAGYVTKTYLEQKINDVSTGLKEELVRFKGQVSTMIVQAGKTAEIPAVEPDLPAPEPAEKRRTIKCEFCNRLFKEEAARKIHTAVLHATGEGLSFKDNRREVKTKSVFLDNPSQSSQHTNRQSYKQSLRMLEELSPSMAPAIQRQLNAFIRRKRRINYRNWQEATGGLRQAPVQKLDRF